MWLGIDGSYLQRSHCKNITYYPSPVSRVPPDWIFDFEIGLVGGERGAMIGQLLREVYAAVRGGQHRLAAMGIRSGANACSLRVGSRARSSLIKSSSSQHLRVVFAQGIDLTKGEAVELRSAMSLAPRLECDEQ